MNLVTSLNHNFGAPKLGTQDIENLFSHLALSAPEHMIAYDYTENKKKFHKRYGVRYSFLKTLKHLPKEYFDERIKDFMISCRCLNSLWLASEYHKDGLVHYHGIIDIKDQRGFKSLLAKFERIGSFHLMNLKDENNYACYSLKEQPITDIVSEGLINFVKQRALSINNKNVPELYEQH